MVFWQFYGHDSRELPKDTIRQGDRRVEMGARFPTDIDAEHDTQTNFDVSENTRRLRATKTYPQPHEMDW